MRCKRQPKSSEKPIVTALVILANLMPLIFLAVVGTMLTRMNLYEWRHSLGLSIVYGFGIALICLIIFGSGAGTLLELGIRCAFLLLFLLPVMWFWPLQHPHKANVPVRSSQRIQETTR